MQCGTILSCVEEQTSSAAEGGNQPRTYEIIYNLPQAGQYPLRPDDRVLSCRAIDMCYYFATPFKYSYCFPIFSDSGQWIWFQGNCTIWTHVESSLLPHVFAANVSASIARWVSLLAVELPTCSKCSQHWEETSMPRKLMRAQGGPLLREASTDFLYFHTFSQLCIGYSMVNHWDA